MSTADKDNYKRRFLDVGNSFIFGWNKGDNPPRKPPPKPAAAGRIPTEQFETRRQDYSRSASAAGAQRTGSDADLLGFVGSRARRAGAARRIFGD
jgi:hypothetical protein